MNLYKRLIKKKRIGLFSVFHLCIGVLIITLDACTTPDTQQDPTDTQKHISLSNDTSTNADTTVLPSSTANQAQEQIEQILLSYYNDLSEENLSNTTYFAPEVENFFGRENISQQEVVQSVERGFANVEDRIIQIDIPTLEVDQKGDRYVATFSGNVQYTQSSDQALIKERFQNRVTFNREFEIIRYETVENQRKSEPSASLSKRSSDNSSADELIVAVQAFIDAIQRGDMSQAETYIDTRSGFYFITRPGAMDAVYKGTSLAKVLEEAYSTRALTLLKRGSCSSPQYESLPTFDCESFSKRGCFIEETQSYDKLSHLMGVLTKNELAKFDTQSITVAKEVETRVTHQVLITDIAVSMSWGRKGDQWYLYILDIASYDCSA